MIVYLSIPMLMFFLWLVNIFLKIKKDTILRIGMSYLFVISSFRSTSLGADSFNYIKAFKIIGNSGTYYMEKGYVFLNRLVSMFTSNYTVLILIVNSIFFLSLSYYIKKFVDKNYWIYCLMFISLQPYIFLQTTFNIIRQCCAVSFVIIAMCFLVNSIRFKHKFTGYIMFNIMTIIGAQFHRSAYLFLAIPIIFLIKMNKNRWRFLAFVFIGFNFITFSRMISRVELLAGYTKYSNYGASILNNSAYIILVLLYLFWITSYYENLELDKWEQNFYDLYLFSIVFLLFAVSNDMVYRVYIIMAIISLPAIQIIFKNDKSSKIVLSHRLNFKRVRVFSFALCSYYFFFFIGYIFYLYINYNSIYIPYHTIFWKG